MQSTVHVRRAMLAVCFSTALAACGGGGGNDIAGPGEVPSPPSVPNPPVAPNPPAAPPPTHFTGLPDFHPASVVFGQMDTVSNARNQGVTLNGATVSDAAGIAVSADGRLFVADTGNRRVLIAGALPSEHGQAAQSVLGQLDLVSDDLQELDTYEQAQGVSVGAGKIAVVDRSGHRVLIYDDVPIVGTAHPIVVVGQQGMDRHDETCDKSTLSFPSAVQITPDGKLLVADTGHSRVLIWETIPLAGEHGSPAKVVLGQPDFFQCERNSARPAGPSSMTLDLPEGVWSDGTRVAVADTANNRVLLWDSVNTVFPSGHAPSRVLGHSSFSSSILEPAARDTVAGARSVAFSGTHLAVADGNNRVLLWNSWPSENMQLADSVLGQRDFLADSENAGAATPSAESMSGPAGLAFHLNKLLVMDRGNNRVLIFESH